MYKVKKTMEISASHSLHFSKAGADEPMHGHNWTVTVWCRGRELDEDGLLVDFLDIEKRIHDYLDHGNLNDLLPFNPSTENLARWICEQVPHCYRVDVKECEGNEASYVADANQA